MVLWFFVCPLVIIWRSDMMTTLQGSVSYCLTQSFGLVSISTEFNELIGLEARIAKEEALTKGKSRGEKLHVKVRATLKPLP